MPRRFQPGHVVLLGIVFTAALYAPAVRSDFILDDFTLILLNPVLDSWSHWHLAFTQHVWGAVDPPVEPRHYRPLHVLWMLLNKQAFGGVAPWWHFMSLVLHLASTLLVYRLALHFAGEERPWTAALAAVLFALHPVHAEAVVWISAVTDLLATFFLLAAFLLYLTYRDTARKWQLAASLACATAALMSKETTVVFPVVIAAYESMRERDRRRPLLSFVYALPVALYFVARVIAIPAAPPAVVDATAFQVVTSAPLVLLRYAEMLLWPTQLSFFYAPELTQLWSWRAAMALAILLISVITLLRLVRRDPGLRPPLLWLAAFAVVPLAAIAVFNRDNWLHDRHMYLPSVGFCWLVAVLLMRVPSRKLRAASATAVVLLAALGLYRQLPRFQDEIALYTHAIERAPMNLELRLAYANTLAMHGRHDDSRLQYESLVRLAPGSAEAWAILGMDYADQIRLQEARDTLRRALGLTRLGSGLQKRVLYRLGVVELGLNELEAAESHLRRAIAADPEGWNFHATLAEVLRRQGRAAEAEEEMGKETAARRAAITRRAARPGG
jgi:protein O-mannosyl-transferase